MPLPSHCRTGARRRRLVQFPCSGRAGPLPGHPAACKCHWSCWRVAVGLPARLMAWKCPFVLCVHCLTLVKLNFKTGAWPSCKWYDITREQVGRNATVPGVMEFNAFLSQAVQLKSPCFCLRKCYRTAVRTKPSHTAALQKTVRDFRSGAVTCDRVH